MSLGIGLPGIAQNLLQYVPPVLSTKQNTDTNTSLLLTTLDLARYDRNPEVKPYVNTVQIIDANDPWPPRWYTTTPIYTDKEFAADTQQSQMRFNFLIDAKVDAGDLSFCKILTTPKKGENILDHPAFAGYILLNKKMEPVDTVKSRDAFGGLYWHDFRTNPKIERLVSIRKELNIDLRSATGNPADSAIHSEIDYIQVFDKHDSVIFNWNPMDHLDSSYFNFKENLNSSRSFTSNNTGIIEWTRLTSALWDYDGNILYAMRMIGLAKISRQDGHIIWRIDHKDMPIISGTDTMEWYSPHDFNYLYETDTSAFYSLFATGWVNFPQARGVVFEMNKKTNKFKIVKNLWPKKKYMGLGQGGCDYTREGDFTISYGRIEDSVTSESNFRDEIEYGRKDSLYNIFQLPKWNYVYKAHRLENWPKPPRPIIVVKGGYLQVLGNLHAYNWYLLSDPDRTTATKIGSGKRIIPTRGGIYCVEGEYGIGYVVSKPLTYRHNEPF